MNQGHEKVPALAQNLPQSETAQSMPGQIVDSTAGIEGKVAEIAQSGPSNSQSGTGDTTAQQNSAKQGATALTEDREALKQRLLQHAPAEPKMKAEVEAALLAQKEDLEEKIVTFSRKHSYHQLSMAIMRLREVIRQLEELAQMSYEALKELWLKAVHKFA